MATEFYNLDEEGDRIIEIGRHKGRTFRLIRARYPSYCKWAVKKAQEGETSDGLRELATYLISCSDAEML